MRKPCREVISPVLLFHVYSPHGAATLRKIDPQTWFLHEKNTGGGAHPPPLALFQNFIYLFKKQFPAATMGNM